MPFPVLVGSNGRIFLKSHFSEEITTGSVVNILTLVPNLLAIYCMTMSHVTGVAVPGCCAFSVVRSVCGGV